MTVYHTTKSDLAFVEQIIWNFGDRIEYSPDRSPGDRWRFDGKSIPQRQLCREVLRPYGESILDIRPEILKSLNKVRKLGSQQSVLLLLRERLNNVPF